MQKAAQAYLQTQITTTGQGDVVVMLFDGAVNYLNKAAEQLLAGDMAGKGMNISRALDVIGELDASLNVEKGGELANNLRGLYSFCQNHLVKANIRKDPAMIDDVIRVLSGLRGAYAEILSQPEAQAAAREAAASLGAQAISVAKKQPGIRNSAGITPQPGAGARMRASYARASGDQCAATPEQPLPESAIAAGQPGPATPAGTEPAAGQGEHKGDPEEGLMPPLPGALGQKFGGSGMFRKYAAMQK